ncbi:hypothetical protein [Arvimicrobium flavum]|uniref:hypothetical protein n=1 Tax=Arvimicrobium flavum TaxID=3393320 RepID=UPI00237C1597|nr:hypothetical protein [Mesorhizobium shangrilense]
MTHTALSPEKHPEVLPSGLRARLRASAPPPRMAMAGAALWTVAIAASAGYGLYVRGWQTAETARIILGIIVFGAALAFPIALWGARFLAIGRPAPVAFVAFFISSVLITAGVTAVTYALYYRLYFVQWHDAPFTKTWAIQFFFTVAGALFQFAVLGLRLYLPFGLVVALMGSLWFARMSR